MQQNRKLVRLTAGTGQHFVYPVWIGREKESQGTRPGRHSGLRESERRRRSDEGERRCRGDAQKAAKQEKVMGGAAEGARGAEERKREKRRVRKGRRAKRKVEPGAEEERTVERATRRPTKNQ